MKMQELVTDPPAWKFIDELEMHKECQRDNLKFLQFLTDRLVKLTTGAGS